MDKSSDDTKNDSVEANGEKPSVSSTDKPECAVCLQPCVQPVQLPCRHIFCYLCVKGVTHRSKKCAMCRQEIPANYLDNPVLIQISQTETSSEDAYEWFYEGRNGWWQYDERTSNEIECAFQKGERRCEVLIAGFLYVIDFDERHQFRRCDPFRVRRVKRDLSSIPKKGIAGIRLVTESVEAEGAARGNDSISSPVETSSPKAENTSDVVSELNTSASSDSQNSDSSGPETPENMGRKTPDADSPRGARYHTCSSEKKK